MESMGRRCRFALAPERWTGASAREIIETVVTGMVLGHATHRALLHALVLYADAHVDADFRRRVAELNAAAVEQVVALLLMRREEITHPDLTNAVRLALLVVASTLGRWVHPDSERVFSFPDAKLLARELTSMVAAYLGVAP